MPEISPHISVIIPAYNRAHVIGTALESIAAQAYPGVEVIVVDDGSRDRETLIQVVEAFRARFNGDVMIIHQGNAGPGEARAHGLRRSSGHYIQYLDSDDMLLPGTLRRHVAALEANPDAVMCYGITLEEKPDGSRKERKFARNYVPDFLEATLQWRRWNTSNPLWRYPGENWRTRQWWSNQATNQDFVHDVRVACVNQRMIFVPEPAMLYRVVTDDRRSAERGMYIIKARFTTMMEARQAMEEACLLSNHRYALRFAERCYFESIQAGKYGCWDLSIQLADWAFKYFPSAGLKAESLLGVLATRLLSHMNAGDRVSVAALKRIFRLHKWLHSPDLHLYRTP